MLAYLIILGTTVAGMMQAPYWAIIAGACILTLLQMIERGRLFASPTNVGTSDEESFAILSALLNGTASAAAAFLLGRATAWLWGL